MYGVVYKIRNLINSDEYIGQTICSLNKRWREHCGNKSECRYLSSAIKKYGKENFEIKVLAKCNSLEEMNHRETYYIKLFKTLAPNGYNLNTGGNSRLISDDTRAKLSVSLSGTKNGFFGKKHTLETRIKISNANKGHVRRSGFSHTEAQKALIGSYHKGKIETTETRLKKSKAKIGNKNNFFGKTHSKETRDKISFHRSKPIFCIETQMFFNSIKDAALKLNTHSVTIREVLTKKKNNYKGLTFIYV